MIDRLKMLSKYILQFNSVFLISASQNGPLDNYCSYIFVLVMLTFGLRNVNHVMAPLPSLVGYYDYLSQYISYTAMYKVDTIQLQVQGVPRGMQYCSSMRRILNMKRDRFFHKSVSVKIIFHFLWPILF